MTGDTLQSSTEVPVKFVFCQLLGEKCFKPRSQSKILVPLVLLRVIFKVSDEQPSPFYMDQCPTASMHGPAMHAIRAHCMMSIILATNSSRSQSPLVRVVIHLFLHKHG